MSDSDQQQAVINFLSGLHDNTGATASRIDTHTASVFLVGDIAYKIKRAIRFPFLDYSTLQNRHDACVKELAINRRLAPDLYLGVVPITKGPGSGLEIEGSGAVIEWALKMRRFDETQTLDLLVPKGLLDEQFADELVLVIASMHQQADAADSSKWFDALRRFIEQSGSALGARPAMFDARKVRLLELSCRLSLERIMPILRDRAGRGFVRRCHGDLHLANIVVINGRPQPFDAIEFDETVASGDVMYDLAFPLMDLINYGACGPATIILDRYLSKAAGCRDFDGLQALPLFMALRAAIRAQVTAAKFERLHNDAHFSDSRRYFDLAMHLISPPAPILIAVGGLSGTGKSVLARSLAPLIKPEPGAILLRSDIERKLIAGVGETERLSAQHYTAQSSVRVYERLREKAAAILKYGHSVIVDAVHATPEERHGIGKIAEAAGVSFAGLFLTTDVATRIRRIANRTNDASDATAETAALQENYDLGENHWAAVDASGPPSELVANATAALASMRDSQRTT